MTKFFKRCFQALLILFSALIITALGVINFVNPNQFKKTLEDAVLESTGITLNVKGDIQWQWFPLLSLAFNDVAIQNKPPFSGDFLSVKTLKAQCQLLPLFLGKIALGVQLRDFDLALSYNKAGKANVEALMASLASKTDKTSSTKRFKPTVMINDLSLEDGRITFSDLSKNTDYELKHFNLSGLNLFKSMLGISTHLKTSFELNSQKKSVGTFVFTTDWKLKLSEEQLALNKMSLTIKLPNGQTNTLTGNTEIQTWSNNLTIHANLLANHLQFDTMRIDGLKATLNGKNHLFEAKPIEIKMGSSIQKVNLKIDTHTSTPKIYLATEPSSIEINDLMTLFGKKNKLFGSANLNVNVMTTGTDPNAWQNNLSGSANLRIVNGKLMGIDLVKLLKEAQAKIYTLIDSLTRNLSMDSLSVINTEMKKWDTNPNSNAFTPFSEMNATASISQGIINNQSFKMTDPEYTLNGQGVVNPLQNTLSYTVNVALNKNPYAANDKIGNFLFNTPILINVNGTLSDPKIRPDLSGYFKKGMVYIQKQVVEKVINKVIDKAAGVGGPVGTVLEKAFGGLLNNQ